MFRVSVADVAGLTWIPACAGMTTLCGSVILADARIHVQGFGGEGGWFDMDSRLRGNDDIVWLRHPRGCEDPCSGFWWQTELD
jgi:hypothetical protein